MPFASLFLRMPGGFAKYSRNLLLATRTSIRERHNTSCSGEVEDPIVLTDDGSTVVCWHPEKEFPYEYTKPLPVLAEENQSSVLKRSLSDAYKKLRKPSEESDRQELMKITYTSKHRWFPRSRDKKAKKTPSDRPYL